METIGVGIACSLLGVTISYLTFQKNNRRDIRMETREEVETRTKLDYISKGVDDIRIDIKAHQRDIQDLKERVVKTDESLRAAHRRLDAIEEER